MRTSSKCQKNVKNARAKRAKILFFIVKYANLWGFFCRHRCGCLSNEDDGSNNVTNLHTGKWKALVLHAVFIFVHFADVLVLSTTWNDLFCSCVDYGSRWWLSFNFVLSLKNCFLFNSRIVRTQFASVMTLNNWEVIAWNCNFAFLVETQSFSSRWRFRCRQSRLCSLIHVVDRTRKCTCKACETTVFLLLNVQICDLIVPVIVVVA